MTERARVSVWAACAVVVFAALVVWVYRRSTESAAVVKTPALRLGLRSEQIGDELRLSWNPKVPPFNLSPEADLLIEDGTHRTQLLLTDRDIMKGHILYSAYTDSVVFRMKAFDRDHHSTDESLHVIQSRSTFEPDGADSTPPAQVRSPQSIAIRTPVNPADRKNGGILHSVAKVGKAPARLWPFHHRGPARSH